VSAAPSIDPLRWYRMRDLEELLGAEAAAKLATYQIRSYGAYGRDVIREARAAGVEVLEASP
jgi:hypothetical protein